MADQDFYTGLNRKIIRRDVLCFAILVFWLAFVVAINVAARDGYISQSMFWMSGLVSAAIIVYSLMLIVDSNAKLEKLATNGDDEPREAVFKTSRKSDAS